MYAGRTANPISAMVAGQANRYDDPMANRRPLFAAATSEDLPRVLVVAELGVNHDGCVERALELVRAAATAGADAVKLQLFAPQRLLSNQARLAAYQRHKAANLYQMLASLALSPRAMNAVQQAADDAGLAFIVTPFSPADVGDLAGLGVDAVKVASPDAVNIPLMQIAAVLGKPLLISTGTCELEELTMAADLLGRHSPGGCLLQCVSSYPVRAQDAAIGAIAALRDRFGLPVGYSDHTTDLSTGALAVAAGAVAIEKHLTYDTGAEGPDHASSLEPAMFGDYVAQVRDATVRLGPYRKVVLPVEADIRKVARQSVCAVRDLETGHVLSNSDLTVKRPGTGIPAVSLPELTGRRLARPVRANDLLTTSDIAPG